MSRGRKIIVICGAREHGKSSRIRELMNGRPAEPVIISDMSRQKAYQDMPEISLDQFTRMKKGRYKVCDPDYHGFYKTAYDHFRGGLVVGEDASEYCGPQRDMKIYPMLIGLRHRGIDLVLVFHSINETPRYIIRQTNDFVLLKTGDNISEVIDRFPEDRQSEVRAAFKRVNQHPDRYYWERITLLKTGTR